MQPLLKWSSPGGGNQEFSLEKAEIQVGRLSESDIVFTNPYVSRRHAKIRREGEQFLLEDLQSTHGTYVNGVKVSQHVLRHGDRVSLGRDQVELQFIAEPSPPSITGGLGDEDLEKSVLQLTSVIPLGQEDTSHLEKISHILDFQYQWEQSFSPERTFRQILEAALKLSGAERGYVLLKSDPDFKYVVGMNGLGQLLSESEFQTSHSIVKEVSTEGKPVLMTENIDQAFAQQQSILAMDLRAVACMPLKWISADSDEPEVRGILYLDSTKTMHALSGLDQKILNKLAVEAANVFEKLELIQAFEEKKAVEKELALARETQEMLIPQKLPEVEGFRIAAFSQPTRHVGGDFYDFLPAGASSFTGVLADVSGKGISAALLSSLVQGALQMECRAGHPLSDSLDMVNTYLCQRSQSNRFVTLFVLRLDAEGQGEYLSAGHNPSYLYRSADGSIEELEATNLILGAFEKARFSSVPIRMEPGDVLLVYSDGITDAMNPGDEMFGEERLKTLVRQTAGVGCKALETAIRGAIQKFTEGMAQTDDMTVMILQRN